MDSLSSGLGRPTFGGIASGLDTNALLEGLLAIERQPLSRLRARRSEIESQRGLMRDFNSLLLKLRDAAKEIDNRNSTGSGASSNEEFLRYTGSSTNEDIVTVRAGSGASPGDIDILVEQLARGSRRFSNSYTETGALTALTAGQNITVALNDADPTTVPPTEATNIQIDATGDLSLQDIRDQINTSADNNGKVRADILQLNDDSFQLVLTSTGEGTQNQLTVTGDLTIEPPAPPLDPTEVPPVSPDDAIDSQVQIFGQTVTRSSNTLDDVLSGITLDLKTVSDRSEEGAGEFIPETVTVDVDTDEIAEAIENFTKAYNNVVSFVERQFSVDSDTNRGGPLSGDFSLRSIQGQLQGMISSAYSFTTNPNNPFAPSGAGELGGVISNIGIELESGGRIKLNREKLDEALDLDALSVREFLSGRSRADGDPVEFDQGFATAMVELLEPIVRSGDGALATREEGFNTRIESFDKSIERFEARISSREETLVARFSELERIVSGLQSQQGFLAGLG